MDNSNQLKATLLGMPFGTATARMRKALLFDMAKRLNMLNCFQCGREIYDISEFSIEHKEPWQRAVNPSEAFFSVDNLAFSHHRCNVSAAKNPNKRYDSTRERKRVQFARYYEKNSEQFLLRKRERYRKAKI
jgi:hypothetical protein